MHISAHNNAAYPPLNREKRVAKRCFENVERALAAVTRFSHPHAMSAALLAVLTVMKPRLLPVTYSNVFSGFACPRLT